MTSNMLGYVSHETIFSETIWDSALAAGGMYALARTSSAENPVVLVWNAAMVGSFQPLLTYAGFDGIFKKKVNCLSPILATVFCNGLSLTLLPGASRLLVSDEAKFNAIAAIYLLAMTKGLTRHVFKTGIYPSLKPLAQLSFVAVQAPFKGVASVYDRVINSQSVLGSVRKISWLWKRNCEPTPEHKEM